MTNKYLVDIKIYDEDDNEIQVTSVYFYRGRRETRMEPAEPAELEVIESVPADYEFTYEQMEEMQIEFEESLRCF